MYNLRKKYCVYIPMDIFVNLNITDYFQKTNKTNMKLGKLAHI